MALWNKDFWQVPGMRKLESRILQTAILGSFLLRQATLRQGSRTCPPEECSRFTPSRTKQSGLQGASESWGCVSVCPSLNFWGRVAGSKSACVWWEWKEQVQTLCLPGSYFAGFFWKCPANCWQLFLMENTNRLGSIPSLLPIMRKLHLLSPAILRKSFAVIPTNPITDCWVASGVSLLRSVTSLSRAYVFQFVMWSEPL